MYDLDFFDSMMVDIVPASQTPEKRPSIKVTGMPGKHVPPGVLGTANDILGAVSYNIGSGVDSNAKLVVRCRLRTDGWLSLGMLKGQMRMVSSAVIGEQIESPVSFATI